MTPAGLIGVGDLALAAHLKITDALLGANAVAGVLISAKVVAANKVRVTLFNVTKAPVDIPSGTLNVLAFDSSARTGQSSDAWQVLHTPTVVLGPGDRVYSQAQHKVAGGLLQATASTYIQCERLS